MDNKIKLTFSYVHIYNRLEKDKKMFQNYNQNINLQ